MTRLLHEGPHKIVISFLLLSDGLDSKLLLGLLTNFCFELSCKTSNSSSHLELLELFFFHSHYSRFLSKYIFFSAETLASTIIGNKRDGRFGPHFSLVALLCRWESPILPQCGVWVCGWCPVFPR